MPLHLTGLVSRHALTHPEESQPTPAYERVLKFNPNHGPDGKFSSGKGGGGGGATPDYSKNKNYMTPAGYRRNAAAEDALSKGVKRRAGDRISGPNPNPSTNYRPLPEKSTQQRMDGGYFSAGQGVTYDPKLQGGGEKGHDVIRTGVDLFEGFTPTGLPKHKALSPEEQAASDTKYWADVKSTVAAKYKAGKLKLTDTQKQFYGITGSLDKSGTPTKRSTFS